MEESWFHIPFFVYGTLKRGEEREGMWPHTPVEIRSAALHAALYDLGPYPALGDGNDVVVGELWFIAKEHMPDTLAALDAIEGFNQPAAEDLYIRRKVVCKDETGEEHPAYTYYFADEQALAQVRRIFPNEAGVCGWTAEQP